MSQEQTKFCAMIRYGSKTDPWMIKQHNYSPSMFISYKFHKNARINFLQKAKFLGEIDAEKAICFVLSLRLTKLYKYHFLKTYCGIAVNQYDFVLPEYKMPTESWPLQ